jgi:hypothetical protein
LVSNDEARLVKSATSVRRYLDSADLRDPEWVEDKQLLVHEVWQGHRKFVEQIVQLGFHLAHEAPRRVVLNAALDVYSKLIEGPIRHFGCVAMIAARVANQKRARFNQQAVDASSPARLLDYFGNSDPTVWESANTLMRNAEAHYSFELTEEGVVFRDRDPHTGTSREETLSDDDFIEALSALTETLAAFEIALLPYLWGHASGEVQSSLEILSSDPNERAAAIRAVGGLRGFVEMTLDEDEEGLHLHTSYLGHEPNPYIEILPTLAAIWSAWSTPRVTVHVKGTRPKSVGFERSKFEWLPVDNELIRNHKVSLKMWDVRVRTRHENDQARRDIDVRYLFLPYFLQTIDLAQCLQTPWPDEETAGELLEYLGWLSTTLTETAVDPGLEDLRSDVVKGAQNAAALMGTWRIARRGRDENWALRAHRAFISSVRSLAQLMDRSLEHIVDHPLASRWLTQISSHRPRRVEAELLIPSINPHGFRHHQGKTWSRRCGKRMTFV